MKSLITSVCQYLVLSLLVLFFFSCSQKLTRAELEDKKKAKNIQAIPDSAKAVLPRVNPVGKNVVIDTLLHPLCGLYTTGSIKNVFFKQIVQQKVSEFYNANQLNTKWLYDQSPTELYHALTDVLNNASRYGLRSSDYDVAQIEARVTDLYKSDTISLANLVDIDLHITEMYFLFTTHLMIGKITNAGYGKYIWKMPSKEITTQDVSLLLAAQKGDQIWQSIVSVQPANAQYAKLVNALAYYQALEKKPAALPTIVMTGKVKQGEKNEAIPLIRKKLSLTDLHVYPMLMDSTTGAWDSLRYDQTLADAIKVFQLKHGLEPDGIIGEKTLKFLNQSFSEKADLIALNMERLRWSPQKYSDNCIRVNVPEYKLRVYETDKPALEMRVIVGATDKPTPIFTEELEHIVFSPTWTVPVSIIKEEIIPRLKANPSYYAEKNYAFYKKDVEIDPIGEVWNDETNPYQYRVVQKPGPDNSLGLVKFVMPNNMSVYMHDTPNRRLFSKEYRALSHGCVRLSEPAKFAAYLLRDQKGWTPERISKAMSKNETATIHLKKHYDVHIEYYTAWVDEDGQVNFREDIYGHDKVQLQQLFPVQKPSPTYAGVETNVNSTVSQ